jgi:L-ribulose-5-phosphate 3-epimerase
MMKIAGHTMGTPEYSLFDAINLFASIGFDGIEIIVQDDYSCGIPLHQPKKNLVELKTFSDDHGVKIPALTPYFSHFNSTNQSIRAKEIEGVRRVFEIASIVGAKFIRIYAGNTSEPGSVDSEVEEALLVESMQLLAEEAEAHDLNIVLENHFNTFTVSAASSVRIVDRIDHTRVGILYDQANLSFTNNEEYTEAIGLQGSRILYVHVKDFKFKGLNREFKSSNVARPDQNDRNVVSTVVGQGILQWPEILDSLNSIGYTGWLSLEYEWRWHPNDLPDARIGMKASFEYLKACLSKIQ